MDAALLQVPILVVEYIDMNKSVQKKFDINERGNKRTLSLVVKTPETVLAYIDHMVVPFVLKRGLMTYKHRHPEDEDNNRLDVLEITFDVQWDPTKFNESSFFYCDAIGIPPICLTIWFALAPLQHPLLFLALHPDLP